jgi:hypothetical protein
MRWMPHRSWEFAGAVEASSTPRNASALNALLRASYNLDSAAVRR